MAHNGLSQDNKTLRFKIIHYFHPERIVIDMIVQVSARSLWERACKTYVWYLVKILSKEWISGTSNASDVVVSIRCHLSWYDLRFWRCATTPSLIWLAPLSKHSSLTPQYSSLMANALFFLSKIQSFFRSLFRESELTTTNKVEAQLSLSWSGIFFHIY